MSRECSIAISQAKLSDGPSKSMESHSLSSLMIAVPASTISGAANYRLGIGVGR
jgi:hypothetical protein